MTKEFNFTLLNKIAKAHGIVLFGSTSAAQIPINELVQDYDISQKIYNRSIEGLTIENAGKYLDSCIYNLNPDKIVLNLGEEDLKSNCDIKQLMEQYLWILYTIHTVLPHATLVLTSVCGEDEQTAFFNESLKKLAGEFGCEYFEIPSLQASDEYAIQFLRTIKSVFYNPDMDYADIVQYCAI